jgi:transcriptional regulator with XRE-family HTH domain
MFGKRLKQLREDNDLRQEDVGKIVNVEKSTVSQWESGKRTPDVETIMKLADYFNVSIDYILGKTDIRTPIETIAAHRSDDPMSELPEEARKSLEEFKEFILRKYGKGSE